MLPTKLSSLCSLGESERSSALSVGFNMIECQINDIKILQSEIKVVKMSYEELIKLERRSGFIQIECTCKIS